MMKRLLPLLLAACGGGAAPGDAGVGDAGFDAGVRRPDGGEEEVVFAHNAVRARAMPAPMPALPAMTWHARAAAVAAQWAEGCRFMHNPAISGNYGENIFASYGGAKTPTQVVEHWASEAPNYDHAMNRCSGECGHYTQIVWRQSTGVGCAWKSCDANSPFGANAVPWLFWVCDYAPAGNFVGQRPY